MTMMRSQTLSAQRKTQTLGLSVAVGLTLIVAPLQARVSSPQEISSRPNAHCQNPRWSPNGKRLAIDVYNPRAETHEVFIVKLGSAGAPMGEEKVRIAGLSRSRLSGGNAPPVLEFAWAPDMDTPYVFSTQGSRRNFDRYADGSFLTKNLGNDGQPAWAPSGRYLVFTSQQQSSGDLWYIDFEAGDGEPKPLFETRAQTEYLPRFAPREDKLLFIRSQGEQRGQDIVLIENLQRPRSEKLLTNWSGDEIRPSWSPDGKWIAFYSNQESRNPKLFDLWVIDQSGGNKRRLAKDVVVDNHQGPAWSRDSSTVIYVKRDFDRHNPILWVRKDGSARGGLVSQTQLNSDLSVYHSRDGGSKLAFRAIGLQSTRQKNWQRIYMVDFTMDDLR